MPIEPTVLVIDGGDAPRAALTHRVRQMGYRAMRAKTPEEAFAIVEEHRHQVAAALIPPDLAVADLSGALESLAGRAPQGLAYVVAGVCPSEESLVGLRAAGLRLALWEPIDDARLRFQINRALAGASGQELSRGEMRAPLDIPAHVIQAGRRKSARVYTLSSGGVYLDTERPSMRNAAIQVELDLWPSPVCAPGVVVYTSVPGNLRRNNLPNGMGVCFHGSRGGRVGPHSARRGRVVAPAHALTARAIRSPRRGRPAARRTPRSSRRCRARRTDRSPRSDCAASRSSASNTITEPHGRSAASKSGPAKTTRPASASGFRFARCASRCTLRSSRPRAPSRPTRMKSATRRSPRRTLRRAG